MPVPPSVIRKAVAIAAEMEAIQTGFERTMAEFVAQHDARAMLSETHYTEQTASVARQAEAEEHQLRALQTLGIPFAAAVGLALTDDSAPELWETALGKTGAECQHVSERADFLSRGLPDIEAEPSTLAAYCWDHIQVFFSTCVGLASWRKLVKQGPNAVDLVIIDEAAHATATETLIPMLYSRRTVLIGDEMQLPPSAPMDLDCKARCPVTLSTRNEGPKNKEREGIAAAVEMSPCWLERSYFEWLWLNCSQIPRGNMGMFSASEEVRRLLNGDQFTRIVTHSRTFVINGLTGGLLPISFWKSHADWQLYPSPENPEKLFKRASGEATKVNVKIVDRAATGREELQRVIESGDVMWRQEYGVPPGTFEVPSEPERIELSWVLAFLLLKADSTCELYSAHRSPVNLLDDATSDRDYLRQVCQSLKPWMLDTESARSHLQKWSDVVSESGEAGLGRTPGEVLVRLFDPDRTLRFEDSRTRGQDKTLTRLCQALLRGRVWDPYTCNLMRIVPGNAATASRTALIRGVYDLRSAIRPLVFAPGTMPSLNLVAWWDEWQRQYAQGLPQQSIPPRLTTATLLECADSLRDTEFLEKLEWFSAEHNLGHENG